MTTKASHDRGLARGTCLVELPQRSTDRPLALAVR